MRTKWWRKLKSLPTNNDGSEVIEYGLIMALMFLAIVAAVTRTGEVNANTWNTISNEIGQANDS
jgi:pilus assembly protein Flp/PilA